MTKNILEAEKIFKSYYHPSKSDILKGIDLTVAEGESIAIMGTSGEGKTTLLHILGTLEKACQGSIKISGKDISTYKKTLIRNKHIGFIFQFFHLLEDSTVLENVLMPAKIARVNTGKGSQAYNTALSLLDHVGLIKHIEQHAKTLSGGEKQRVAIARALINDPDIIFADEPTGNLDSQNSELISDLLIEFNREKHKALVLVTHDHKLASRLDKQYQLIDGCLLSN